jgi:hypothetical protein
MVIPVKKILYLFFFVPLFCHAQDQNSIWIFGDSAGIDFRNIANPVPVSSGIDSRGSCVSIADTNGNLVLYAATMPYFGPTSVWATKVFNSQHQLIQGTDSITGDSWYNELVLFPKPGRIREYELFSAGLQPNINNGLYYTLIDMKLNGGAGAVVMGNKQISSEVHADCLSAVKHGNGRDWWVIGKLKTPPPILSQFNRFFVYLVASDSIYNPLVFDFNDMTDVSFSKIIWHPAYNHFMLINTRGYMSEFNFDRCEGTITLNRNIYPEQSSNFSRVFLEGAYSPNGNVFYVSRNSYGGTSGNHNYLLQYDLSAPDIPASCDTLDSTTYLPVDCGAVRLAPDGKIYYSQAYISASVWSYPYADSMRNTINENLGVIHNPDITGPGCDFRPFSFYLGGKRTYYGLPNNPQYNLGPLSGSVCDSLTVGIHEFHDEDPGKRSLVFPNPANEILNYVSQDRFEMNESLLLRDYTGREAGNYLLPENQNRFVLPLFNLDAGIYILSRLNDYSNSDEHKVLLIK